MANVPLTLQYTYPLMIYDYLSQSSPSPRRIRLESTVAAAECARAWQRAAGGRKREKTKYPKEIDILILYAKGHSWSVLYPFSTYP